MKRKHVVNQKCIQCGTHQDEGWPTHYARAIAARNPKPFYCRDCKRMKFIFENPEIIKERDKKREERIQKKLDFQKFKNFVEENENARDSLKEAGRKKKEYNKKYFQTEKGKAIYRDSMARRRARVLQALIDLSDEEKKQIRKFYDECPEGFQVDHIIPISKGGKHCMSNLQYLTKEQNRNKRDKLPDLRKFLGVGEEVSNSWLQRKFKLTAESSAEILNEIQALINSKEILC